MSTVTDEMIERFLEAWFGAKWRSNVCFSDGDRNIYRRDTRCALEAAAAARPAPKASEVAERLRKIVSHAPVGMPHSETILEAADLLTAQAAVLAENVDVMSEAHSVINRQLAALTAKDLEIERWKAKEADAYERAHGTLADEIAAKDAETTDLRDALAKVLSEASKELGGVEAGGSEIVEGIIILKSRIAELEAALRPFAEYIVRIDEVWAPSPPPPDQRAFSEISGKTVTYGDLRRTCAVLAPAAEEQT